MAEGGKGDADGVINEGPKKVLAHDADGDAGDGKRIGGGEEIGAEQRDGGGFGGDVRAGGHGEADVGLSEGGGVVDPVADHGDDMAFLLQSNDEG